MIYLPNNPERMVRGERAKGLWNTIVLSTNETKLGIAIGFGVFFILCAAKKPKASRIGR